MSDTEMGEIYRRVTDDGYNYPHERALSGVNLSSGTSDVSSIAGSETSNYLTGICLQSSFASSNVEEGINPITGEIMRDYDDVRDYLEDSPDSLGVIADQFKLTEREGDLYLVIEDLEWPEKFASQIDNAGIDHYMEEVRDDVEKAYDSYIEMFDTYVNNVLDNELNIHVIRTSERQDLIREGMSETDNIDSSKPLDRVYYMGSPDFCQDLENEYGLDEPLTKVDPLRHFPELFRSGDVSHANHPMQNSRLEYYSQNGEIRNPLVLTYQGLGPFSSETAGKDVEADHRINSETLDDLDQKMKDIPVKANKSPAMRLATFFPNRSEQAARVFNSTDEFVDRKDEFLEKARDKGLEGREIGEFMDSKRTELRLKNGRRKSAYQELVEVLQKDLKEIFGAGDRL